MWKHVYKPNASFICACTASLYMHCSPLVSNGTFYSVAIEIIVLDVSSYTYALGGEASTDSVTEHLMTVTKGT